MRKVFLSVLFLVSLAAALAQDKVSNPRFIISGQNPDYIELKKKDFRLYYSRADNKNNNRIADLVLRKFITDYKLCLERELECNPNPGRTKNIFIYPSRKEFLKVADPASIWLVGSNVTACYEPLFNAILIDGESWSKKPRNFFEILSHEVSHMAVAEYCDKVTQASYYFPRSLDEGLALLREKVKRYGTIADARRDHLGRGLRVYAPAELLVDSSRKYPFEMTNLKDKTAFYRQSASLVEFLLSKLGSKKEVIDLGLALGLANSAEEADLILRSFGLGDLRNLEGEWYIYEEKVVGK